MIKIYISKFHDIYTNISIERYLFKHSGDDLILFLWSNNPCVVFGRNQNIYNEVNIEYAKEQEISLARRFSGGGAVYQDRGNFNYTFIAKSDSEIDKLNQIILDVFKNINIDAYFSGRNDLLVNDKKFSGIAYCNDFDHLMYHGTCLIDVNKNILTKVLKPHDYKLKTHSVSSYKSRVINLKEIANISEEDIESSFVNTLSKIDEIKLHRDITLNDEILDTIKFLINEDYVYNDCPGYSYSLEMKLNNSNYSFEIFYEDGVINEVQVYTDDLDVLKKQYYIDLLKGQKIPFASIEKYLSNLNLK